MRLISSSRLRFSLAAALLLVSGLLLSASLPASALTVSPVRLEITVDPGSTYQGETILKNEQKEARTFYSSFENFEARGESGTPYFVPGRDGLAGWIAGAPESVTLQSGERQTIPFTVAVPADAKPGGYFAAILWNDTPPAPSAGGQVAIGAKVGSLVLLRVSGDVEENGGVTAFATEDSETMFNSLPIAFVWRFQNSGGDRVKPEGAVRITNTLGLLTVEIPANPTKGNILPGSTRKFDMVWGEEESGSGSTLGMDFLSAARQQARHWRMGRYTAELDLKYGNAEESTSREQFTFYVLPWQLLTLLLGALIIVLILARFILAGYKRRIIAQARAGISKPRASKPVSRKK